MSKGVQIQNTAMCHEIKGEMEQSALYFRSPFLQE